MMQLRSTATGLVKMLVLAALCLLPLAAAHGGTNKATGNLDISICDDLLSHVWEQEYGSHQSLEAACTCEVASFIDMFQVDCLMAHCPECDDALISDMCLTRGDTFRYFATDLRTAKENAGVTSAVIVAHTEGSYVRRYIAPTSTLGADYTEIRVGNVTCDTAEPRKTECLVYLTATDALETLLINSPEDVSGYPCACEFVDCDGDGTQEGIAFNCTGRAGNYTWGYCDANLNTIASAEALPATTPLRALNTNQFGFDSCFTVS